MFCYSELGLVIEMIYSDKNLELVYWGKTLKLQLSYKYYKT